MIERHKEEGGFGGKGVGGGIHNRPYRVRLPFPFTFWGFFSGVLNPVFFFCIFFPPFFICYASSKSNACFIPSPRIWQRLFASLRDFSVWSRDWGFFLLFALIYFWGSKGNFLQVCWKSFVWKNNKDGKKEWRVERGEQQAESVSESKCTINHWAKLYLSTLYFCTQFSTVTTATRSTAFPAGCVLVLCFRFILVITCASDYEINGGRLRKIDSIDVCL